MNRTSRTTIAQFVDLALNWLLTGLVFLIPLFFLPFTLDIFSVNKHFLLFAGVAVALILWAISFIVKGKLSVTVSPLLLPLGLLAILAIASPIVNKISTPEALVGRAGLFLALFIFVLIASSRPSGLAKWFTTGLILSSVLLALGVVLSFSGLLNQLGFPSWMTGKTFTPAGGMSALVVLLTTTLPLVLNRFKSSGASTIFRRIVLICTTIIVLAGAIIAGILVFPGQEGAPARMPVTTGWQIAVETLKQQPFLGIGTGNYLSAYTRYRPIATNTTSLWNQRFQQAPNEFFHEFTENGILGLMVLLFLSWQAFQLIQMHEPRLFSGIGVSLGILFLSLFLFPLNVVSIAELAALTSILLLDLKVMPVAKSRIYDASFGFVALREGLVEVEKTNPEPEVAAHPIEKVERSSNLLSWIVAILLVALGGTGVFLTSRAWAAEITFRQAVDGIAQNNGTVAYNQLIHTLNLNPLFGTYHRQYADVNLRLANSLAAQPKLSDQDRSNVSQLVQQAIREAKIAAQLNPTDVRNWETLAVIYRAIINVADGARDWTVIAYSEAVRLDPFNPLLRVDLGGVFYNAKDWENAIRSFQAATNVKPDFANAYYNLALAYEQSNRPQEALRAIQATIQNLDTNSPDYAVAQQKLDELTKKAQQSIKAEPATAGTSGANNGQERLAAPEPLPTPLPGANRVKLSQEEAPPPTATPTPVTSAELSPTPTPGQ